MKKLICILITLSFCLTLISCGEKTSPEENPDAPSKESTEETTVEETTEFDNREYVMNNVLTAILSNLKYGIGSGFSISVGELANSFIENYDLQYYTAEEAIEKGYMQESDIEGIESTENFYFFAISGDTMRNPDIPYLTAYNDPAMCGWILLDENNSLEDYGINLCDDLHTCAVMKMTSGF